jgi:Myb-like DNA-binding domain
LAFSFGNNESNPADWILDKNFGRSFDSFASDAGADASSESSSHFNSSVMSDDNKKKLPQLWTPGEDHILVCVVQSQPRPIKWSIVAQFVKDRSGKQCRERYVNHLKPQVKNDVWSPLEDSELFRMFHYHGSKWALMAKLLRGRTDNSIKNRFHHLRRRLEKDLAKKTNAEVVVDQSNFISMTRAMSPFIADMEEESDTTGTFGPFAPSVGLQCKRCALMVPSAQTGRNVCQSTGWCQSCTKMPSYFCDDVLREVLLLARPVVIDEPKLIDVTTAPSSDWTRTTGASRFTLDG